MAFSFVASLSPFSRYFIYDRKRLKRKFSRKCLKVTAQRIWIYFRILSNVSEYKVFNMHCQSTSLRISRGFVLMVRLISTSNVFGGYMMNSQFINVTDVTRGCPERDLWGIFHDKCYQKALHSLSNYTRDEKPYLQDTVFV